MMGLSAANPSDYLFMNFETALGVAIHSTPIFESIKAADSNARISVACSPVVAEVLRHNPFVDILAPCQSPLTNLYQGWLSISDHLRRNLVRPKFGISNAGNQRTRIAIANRCLGLHSTIGFTLAPRLYNVSIPYDTSISLIENNHRICGALGLDCEVTEPLVSFSPDDLSSAEILVRDGTEVRARRTAILVTQTSGGQRTKWIDRRFAEVADYLSGSLGFRVMFTGMANEAEGVDRIRRLMRSPSVQICGLTSIPVLSALMCLADVVVSVDTGPMHLARASQAPLVVLAPAWQSPIEWLPLKAPNAIVLRGVDLPHMPEDYELSEITVEAVTDAIDVLLTKFPPDPSAAAFRVRRSGRSKCAAPGSQQ